MLMVSARQMMIDYMLRGWLSSHGLARTNGSVLANLYLGLSFLFFASWLISKSIEVFVCYASDK